VAGLDPAARRCLFILVLAAGLWATEAIPAFAVALLVIGLSILLLGRPDGVFVAADEPDRWQIFIAPFASPLIWLFLAGFILAEAAARTGLDRTLAGLVFRAAGLAATAVLDRGHGHHLRAVDVHVEHGHRGDDDRGGHAGAAHPAPGTRSGPPCRSASPSRPTSAAWAPWSARRRTPSPPGSCPGRHRAVLPRLDGARPAAGALLAAFLGAFLLYRYHAVRTVPGPARPRRRTGAGPRAPLWQRGVVVLVFSVTLRCGCSARRRRPWWRSCRSRCCP
jgi:solute carrier family 13 (sodium-dependent dicarboxylate transporter), member 2/3/5